MSTGSVAAGRRHWERCTVVHKVAQASEALEGGQTQEQVSERLGVPRSTLRYWLERKADLDGSGVVAQIIESPEGLAFVHQIVVAAHFVMEYRTHKGIRAICEFLRLSGLSRFVGASYGSQQGVASQMEEQIVAFGDRNDRDLGARMAPRAINLVQDETFHPAICLVALEPVSDFILLEKYTQKRDAPTWNEQVAQALAGLKVEVIQSTSDEAKGILSHVREGLGAHHSPDLFHFQRALAKDLFAGLRRVVERARADAQAASTRVELWQQMVEQASDPQHPRRRGRPPNYQHHLAAAQEAQRQAEQALEKVEQQAQEARESLRALSDAYHPYDLSSGQERGAETVGQALEKPLGRLQGIISNLCLGERASVGLQRARRLLPELLSTVLFIFTLTQARVRELSLAPPLEQALRQHLIPALYLQSAAAKAPCAEQRRAIQASAERLLAPLRASDSPFAALDEASLRHIEQVGAECAQLFQRSSSCVEGRNGQLSLWHHHLHAIRPRKLRALTIVHNYHSRRRDGQTPAQQFFRLPHASLFEFLCDHIDLPARPARQRPRPPPMPVLAAA